MNDAAEMQGRGVHLRSENTQWPETTCPLGEPLGGDVHHHRMCDLGPNRSSSACHLDDVCRINLIKIESYLQEQLTDGCGMVIASSSVREETHLFQGTRQAARAI